MGELKSIELESSRWHLLQIWKLFVLQSAYIGRAKINKYARNKSIVKYIIFFTKKSFGASKMELSSPLGIKEGSCGRSKSSNISFLAELMVRKMAYLKKYISIYFKHVKQKIKLLLFHKSYV